MNLYSLTQTVGGDLVHLESLTKGPQDPHFIPAKPSLMLKASKADLLIFIGMDLEVGWLPLIIKGSKNPKIQKGKKGYLNVSQFVQALSVPKEKVDRFFGDIHPFGNPHILLDPERAIQISQKISQQLSSLDPEHGQNYEKNQKNFESEVQKKIKEWNKRIYHSGIKKVVSYHSSFEYFLDRFSIELLGLIEEKPGIPLQ